MFRKTYLLLFVLILIPCISHAKTETIFADHKYVMGDNDSKNDARRMCFLEAKRKVLEKSGTYIESHTQSKNYKLTKDEINSYASALLKVETVKEEWKFVGENMAVFITVKANVDTGFIEKQLAKILKDTSVQKNIKDQQNQIGELENKVTLLQKQLLSSNPLQATALRKERATVFADIDQIEARYKYIMLALNDRKKASVELAQRILKFIEIDMTPKEVKYILGEPDDFFESGNFMGLDYGSFRIYIESSKVRRITFYGEEGTMSTVIKTRAYNILKHGIIKEYTIGSSSYGGKAWERQEAEIRQYVLGK
ncbi:MAG: hypothetical protein JRC93_11270 [Deltaproteobacteria bacterium]|nr:hypothetical protein [Deltaproteobacteria bacterium]